MNALVASDFGQLNLDQERATPTPPQGEVLVKIAAAPPQPSDRLNIKGDFPATKFPIIPGRNYAGTVVAPNDSEWLGKRVHGISGNELSFSRDGTHTEYVAVPEDALTEITHNLNWVQAVLVGLTWTTSWLILNRLHAKKGDTVTILGAGANGGMAITEMAKSSLSECNVLRVGRGSKYDVDMSSDPTLSSLKEKTNGKGPDVVVDITGDLDVLARVVKVFRKEDKIGIRFDGIESWKG